MTLPTQPVPAPGFHKNPGARPDTVPADTLVQVQWACGWIDPHPYKIGQLYRWGLTGHPWDIGAIRRAD